ncbi:unnamed protein product [Fraxinus pennsylvanica]|uniref:FAR1 domain-containing protein n=1 Tax=Fraxinus pennsylvanica TaxID=56036 RepID=A0AAD2E761_9LAMI|nr:unnamed protein product [Fraxinus pennsylvanica]
MSPSQEVSSAGGDGMDVDSESTYSCLNASMDKNGVDTDDEHEFTSQNGSSIENNGLKHDVDGRHKDQSPDICSVNQPRIDVNDKHVFQALEAPSSTSSESVQGIKDEACVYLVPKLGMEFESEDHAYKCYNRYALMEGFSIRKDFVNRSNITGLVVSRRYTCYRQGYGSAKRDLKSNKPRKDTRTGCLAHMTITRQPNGKYRVIHFETKHNHEFATSVTAHLLPSQKRISFVEAIEAESAGNSASDGVPKLGMGFDSEDHAYEFYNAYAGRLGFSVRKDYVNRSKVDGAVASRRYTCFREGFRQKDKRGLKVKRPRKETRVGCMAQLVVSRQADGKYRVTQFEEHHNHELVPSCKVRMLRSQKRFSTNQAVESSALEGCNLQPKSLAELLLRGEGAQGNLSYDPIDRETRLPSKRSRRIKLDEAESIRQYFQKTSHRYCVWHSYQNALEHLREVAVRSDSFVNDLCSCIFNQDEEEDFVNSWKVMLDTYGLWENKWLHEKFEEREKWALPYARLAKAKAQIYANKTLQCSTQRAPDTESMTLGSQVWCTQKPTQIYLPNSTKMLSSTDLTQSINHTPIGFSSSRIQVMQQ